MRLDRIEQLARTPRTIDENLLKIHAKPFFFLRGAIRRWESDMMNAPLVFAYVVQANQALYEPEGEMGPAVLLFSTDPRYCRDAEWLANLAERVHALKTSGSRDAEANELAAWLAAEESTFDLPVPTSLTGGVQAQIKSSYVDAATLPGQRIGADNLIPALAFSNGDLVLIPGQLFS